MSADLVALDQLVVTIVSVRRKLGNEAFRVAIAAARTAVATVVMNEAEARAGAGVERKPGVVVPFPKGRKRRDRRRRDQ